MRQVSLLNPFVRLLLAALLLSACGGAAVAEELRNERYIVRLENDGGVTVIADGAEPRLFRPDFAILFRQDNPQIALRPSAIKGVQYNVPAWRTGMDSAKGEGIGTVNTKVSAGDGFDPGILEGDKEGRTNNAFVAGAVARVTASGASLAGNRILWTFPQPSGSSLEAMLDLPAGRGEPRLTFRFTPKQSGWYSVGYVGGPECAPAAMDEMWQPLIWTEKRFPDRSYLTAAFHGPVPGTMVTRGGVTVGVIADPDELPFQPLPTFANSRFGMLVRNAQGNAQPMLFAPILGGQGSKMAAGQSFEFRLRLLVRKGGCVDALEHVAQNLFGFSDIRRNVDCSLNQTLENMIDYGLSPYSRFNEDLRGCAYDTDAPGTVKNVSALHPLSVALVTDNPEIYARRARPIIEFMMSREKFLFATNPEIKVQSPGWRLLGPCAPVSELSALYLMSHGRTPLFLHYAQALLGQERTLNLDVKESGKTWQNYLALYRATSEPAYLEQAKKLADTYLVQRIEKRQTDFKDPESRGMFFWSSFAPNWIDLYELYQETGERRYLEAAGKGARDYAQYIWFCPRIPDESVVVNKDGVAPEYGYLKNRGLGPIRIPEESVPAWRLSEMGLLPESSGTSSGHRAVLLANHAPWMLRLSQELGDSFLHDIARSAVVGRYANFPGYHINTARTTVYEKADYPLREYKALTYNSFHFNHIWPHIAMVIDYLVSDAACRSGGRIDFPSRFAEGYAYIKSKVYGDRPGKFYDRQNIWLWMPKGLARIDNPQVNYIAARDEDGALYLVLMNQSSDDVTAIVELNPQLVSLDSSRKYAVKVWRQNQAADPLALEGGQMSVAVSGKGITALVIDGAGVHPRFGDKLVQPGPPLPPNSSITLDYGGTHGMLISMGPGATHAYVYLQATFQELKQVTLHYRVGDGQWKTAVDSDYPYEFTVELNQQDGVFDFWTEGLSVDGKTGRSKEASLVVRQ